MIMEKPKRKRDHRPWHRRHRVALMVFGVLMLQLLFIIGVFSQPDHYSTFSTKSHLIPLTMVLGSTVYLVLIPMVFFISDPIIGIVAAVVMCGLVAWLVARIWRSGGKPRRWLMYTVGFFAGFISLVGVDMLLKTPPPYHCDRQVSETAQMRLMTFPEEIPDVDDADYDRQVFYLVSQDGGDTWQQVYTLERTWGRENCQRDITLHDGTIDIDAGTHRLISHDRGQSWQMQTITE